MLVTANIFQPLISVFQSVLTFFNGLGFSWGFSIVLLTICVRVVLLPLTIKQFHSMRKLQHLQPQMKAIQTKYKEDKQRQQEEMMKFYRDNEVNPLGSCLPLVAQLPVFISLFYMLRKNLRDDICPHIQTVYRAHYAHNLVQHGTSQVAAHAAAAGQTTECGPVPAAHFLFISDITAQATGLTLILLLILYVGTQLASTLLMSSPTMDKSQQRMMMVLPLVFVIFIIRFPAGLIVYWITTNTWTMVQQYTLKRMMGPPPVAPVVEAPATPARRGGGTGGANGSGAPEGGSGGSGGGLGGLIRGVGSRSGDGQGAGGADKAGAGSTSGRPAGPPPSARKKKKRSGRRR